MNWEDGVELDIRERKPACRGTAAMFESKKEESERASRREWGMKREMRMVESWGIQIYVLWRGEGGDYNEGR